MKLTLYAGNTVPNMQSREDVFASKVRFTPQLDPQDAPKFDFQRSSLLGRMVGVYTKGLPLMVRAIWQIARAILHAPLVLSVAKHDVLRGEIYKIGWYVKRAFAMTIAPFFLDRVAQRIEFKALVATNSEALHRAHYAKSPTAMNYLDSLAEIQEQWRIRYPHPEEYWDALNEVDDEVAENIKLATPTLVAMSYITIKEVRKEKAANENNFSQFFRRADSLDSSVTEIKDRTPKRVRRNTPRRRPGNLFTRLFE